MKRSIIRNHFIYFLLAFTFFFYESCKKTNDFLNAKSNLNDVRPTTLNDFQAILDNDNAMNDAYPGIGLVCSDNVYLTDATFNSVPEYERNAYIWAKDIYDQNSDTDWNNGFAEIEFANIVLDGLNNIMRNASNASQYDEIKGSALFFRAYTYYMLSQTYCKPYISVSAATDPGLPVRTTSDVNQKSTRVSVADTYAQMISDSKSAITLLPKTTGYQTRPAQAAANALLAKIYLSMGDYANAKTYSNNSLDIYNKLLDYNSSAVSLASTFVFPVFPGNQEISFWAYADGYATTIPYGAGGVGFVDTVLYKSYNDNDLRKTLYFLDNGSGQIQFAGTYSGSYYNFCGIATDEVYLIRAECEARLGETSEALSDLNTLLVMRYKTGTFVPLTISDQRSLITEILTERRKELPFTGQLRWEDLRRLNQDPVYAKTWSRTIGGTTYTLRPGDNRYTLPIPDQEIQSSGITQNP